jgi:hypothetical protein
VFAPVSDLSALSRTGAGGGELQEDLELAGGRVLGDEYTEHVIRVRPPPRPPLPPTDGRAWQNRDGIILREGTLLKSDQWLRERERGHEAQGVRGALHFRNVPGTSIYALGQPTADAVDAVVRRVRAEHPDAGRILWITLREEPIVYINGAPYCLRRERFTLRNMKDYGGISAARLEALEERLQQDVQAELSAFGGRALLHTETPSGAVIPVWEAAAPGAVATVRAVLGARGDELVHARIPLTAERAPDFSDIAELMEVAMRSASARAPIVVNCQLGRGRSTLTAVRLSRPGEEGKGR